MGKRGVTKLERVRLGDPPITLRPCQEMYRDVLVEGLYSSRCCHRCLECSGYPDQCGLNSIHPRLIQTVVLLLRLQKLLARNVIKMKGVCCAADATYAIKTCACLLSTAPHVEPPQVQKAIQS